MTGFRSVADNLRQSFRVLADGKPRGVVRELPGVSIASLGVAFQMFNAAFPSEPIETQRDLEERLETARNHFRSRSLNWAFWVCEDWIAPPIRRRLSHTCEMFGLRLSSDMPGLAVDHLKRPARRLPPLDVQRVVCSTSSAATLDDFRAIGSVCFHVPITWFSEVFDSCVAARGSFVCWVAYRDGLPVATAATVSSHGVIGLYNVATAPEFRRRGYGEAVTRYAIEAAVRETGETRVVLESTSQGLHLYQPMGFQFVTRVLVYNSVTRTP